MSRKALIALIFTLALWINSSVAYCAVDSVWGIKFGSPFNSVDGALSERGCSIVEDLTTLKDGQERVSTYRGSFFDRPCNVKVTFRKNSMVKFQFLFVKKGSATSEDVSMFGNYTDLSLKLRSKYGYDKVKESYKGGEKQIWTVGNMEIELACDARSRTNHTTVLTYREKS